MTLTKTDIDDIIKRLSSSKNPIFENEAQFQFCFAMEIKQQYPNLEVFLETKTMELQTKKKNPKKFYTDILVYDSSVDDYTAIELKYKTIESQYNKVKLSYHGAQDLGRFDYFFDIFRIEQLLHNPKHINNLKTDPSDEIIFPNKLNVKNGFAIFLTNDSCYWKVSKAIAEKRNAGKGCLYQEFCFTDNDKILQAQPLKWTKTKGKSCVDGTFRDVDLTFNNGYNFKWNAYLPSSRQPEFKYLITEIH